MLDQHIARIREVPGALPRIAQQVASALELEIAANIAAGRGPDGQPWPPTADGRRPLAGALSAITVRPEGTTIVITVNGVEARHHLGAVKGKLARPLIPTGEIPGPMLEALDRVATKVLADHFGGGQ